jgi:hypothetical protein
MRARWAARDARAKSDLASIIHEVSCPACGVPAAEPCRAISRRTVHPERAKAFRRRRQARKGAHKQGASMHRPCAIGALPKP